MDDDDKLSPKEVEIAARKLTEVFCSLYVGVLLLSGLGWLVYFKAFRTTVSTVKGKIWRRGIVQQSSYFKIVPGFARRQPPPYSNIHSQPAYLMPGLISTSGSDDNCGQVSSSFDRPPSYNSVMYPRLGRY